MDEIESLSSFLRDNEIKLAPNPSYMKD